MRQLAILVALVMLSWQATAQPARPSAAGSSNEPLLSTTLNLNMPEGKLPVCLWGSAIYSPGSQLDYFDTAKKANVCFHCNGDGTWSTPCQ